MREVPECLQRRYKVLDQLVNELNSAMSRQNRETERLEGISDDVGIKLMCQFWNILKEDPECNLTQAVKQRMCVDTKNSGFLQRQQFQCYMTKKFPEDDVKVRGTGKECNSNNVKSLCCQKSRLDSQISNTTCLHSLKSPVKSYSSQVNSEVSSLSKVLCNLKEAASFDKKCTARLNELTETDKQLQAQIQHLEQREREGVQLLKQADCMWSCMEDTYKKKIQESNEKQKTLLKQLKEAEAGAKTWRKNTQDLESQREGLRKCQLEIAEKVSQKSNDLKCLDIEIEGLRKRIETQTKEADAAFRSLSSKKQTSDLKMNMLVADCMRLEKEVEEENQNKIYKEREFSKLVKAARDELKTVSKVLLLKKLGNENLEVEKQGLLKELEWLNENFNQCREICSNREKSVLDELNTLQTDIENFEGKCVQCHECTDTVDIRKFCTDCPRCLAERECLYKNGQCTYDDTMDCVCESVKEKFLGNVFENMQNILARQSQTGPGKAIADCVLKCLKKSRNGKIDKPTRKILRDFILTAVKKNLNLTIIGGAVKTRCEMDKDTYKQLMLCLELFKETNASKVDKGTDSKKEPCRRWGGTSECNCPGDPKTCICAEKAPPPPNEPLPESSATEAKDEEGVEIKICRHKNVTCGVECGVPSVPSNVETDVATTKDPSKKLQFGNNMRAVQCVLGPESLSTTQFIALKSVATGLPYKKPKISSSEVTKNISANIRRHFRELYIEEIMGQYNEVAPIEKVTSLDENDKNMSILERRIEACLCSNITSANVITPSTFKNNNSMMFSLPNTTFLLEDRNILISNASEKKDICISTELGACATKDEIMRVIYDNFVEEHPEITIITCPTKTLSDTSVSSTYTSIPIKLSVTKSVNKARDKNKLDLLQKKVYDTADKIVKDVVSSVNNERRLVNYPDSEWITLISFIEKVTSLIKSKCSESHSRSTLVEMEIKCEGLEAIKDTSQQKCDNKITDKI